MSLLPWPLPEAGRIRVGDLWFDASNPEVRLIAYKEAYLDWRSGLRPDRPVRDAVVQEWFVNRSLAMSDIIRRLEDLVDKDRPLYVRVLDWISSCLPRQDHADDPYE